MDKYLDKYVAIQAIVITAILFAAPYGHDHWDMAEFMAGIFLISAGAVISISAAWQLGAALTPAVKPVRDGKLITAGIYRIVRHPIYLGVIMAAIGWSALWGSLLALGLSFMLIIFFVIKANREEILLEKTYPDYAEYQSRIKFKIFPLIY